MNFKMMFAVTQLVLIAIGMITYGYLVYAVNGDTTQKTGKAMLQGHQMMFYSQLVIQLLQFTVGALLVYKVR